MTQVAINRTAGAPLQPIRVKPRSVGKGAANATKRKSRFAPTAAQEADTANEIEGAYCLREGMI